MSTLALAAPSSRLPLTKIGGFVRAVMMTHLRIVIVSFFLLHVLSSPDLIPPAVGLQFLEF